MTNEAFCLLFKSYGSREIHTDLIRQVEFILQRESKGLQPMGDLLVYLSQITLAQISRTTFIHRRSFRKEGNLGAKALSLRNMHYWSVENLWSFRWIGRQRLDSKCLVQVELLDLTFINGTQTGQSYTKFFKDELGRFIRRSVTTV
ncbi:hypothetical protein K0M31_016038 [Melipona bicolor]|uniref:Uncharacterized protein n=1 Tax=Melipona bicolor TaxID=60889 RepID=A0AA40G6A9_9HYME|nr:hypothetical protein K0M31_016038 [Melipona bicolor]